MAEPRHDKRPWLSLLRSSSNLQSLLVLLAMVVVMSLLSDRFLTPANGWNILRQISVNACLSIGMTMVIVSGGIDLSVGSILALSGAIMAGLVSQSWELGATGYQLEITAWGAIVVGVLVGAALGAFNGLMITVARVPPFIATLGMLSIARGLTMLWTRGFPITGLGPEFAGVGSSFILGAPTPVWIAGILTVVFIVVTTKTRFGKHLYAVGGSERTALLSGINVDRVKVTVYVLAGALSAMAGLITTARLDSAQPNAGTGYELDSIAAVVIGGTSLSGGRGTIFGTIVGCLIIGVLNSGLVLLNVSPFWQQVLKGAVILLAVAIDRLRSGER